MQTDADRVGFFWNGVPRRVRLRGPQARVETRSMIRHDSHFAE
jgi:hypothetical protein